MNMKLPKASNAAATTAPTSSWWTPLPRPWPPATGQGQIIIMFLRSLNSDLWSFLMPLMRSKSLIKFQFINPCNVRSLIASGIVDSLRSHKLVFAAESSRLENSIKSVQISHRERPLTKNRLANRGPRAVLAVLGCRGLDQHISWSLHLQILSQLKWFSSSTGSDRRKQGRRRGEGNCQSLAAAPSLFSSNACFVSSLKPVPHPKAGWLPNPMHAATFYHIRKSIIGQWARHSDPRPTQVKKRADLGSPWWACLSVGFFRHIPFHVDMNDHECIECIL